MEERETRRVAKAHEKAPISRHCTANTGRKTQWGDKEPTICLKAGQVRLQSPLPLDTKKNIKMGCTCDRGSRE